MISKKANITVSFSWIFMIIIGGFFLILAYNIVDKYQENQSSKYDIELRQALRGILNNVGRTEGIEENSLRKLGNIFQNKQVEINCIDNLPLLSIDGKFDGENQFLKNYPTFMTYLDEGQISFTYIAVESFRLPFKTTNVLAIISQKNLIVFDKKSSITEKLNEKFTKSSYRDLNVWNKDFTTISLSQFKDNIKKLNLNSIIFVSDEGKNLPNGFLSDLKPITYQIKIQDNDGYGIINYYDDSGLINSYKYIDFDKSLSLVTMATFSNPENFGCSYNQLIDNTINTFDFYIEKTNYLIKKSSKKQLCSDISVKYDSSGNLDGHQQEVLYNSMNNVLKSSKNEILLQRFNNSNNLNNLITQIDEKSRELESYNCVYVY